MTELLSGLEFQFYSTRFRLEVPRCLFMGEFYACYWIDIRVSWLLLSIVETDESVSRLESWQKEWTDEILMQIDTFGIQMATLEFES